MIRGNNVIMGGCLNIIIKENEMWAKGEIGPLG
jgi:hypothetical protein